MKKKSRLGRLPVLEASCEDAALAARMGHLEWLMKAENVSVDGQDYLSVSFFHRNSLLEGETGPRLRTFFSHEDYITECFLENGRKWRTGCRQNVAYTQWNYDCACADAEDEKKISAWFEKKGEGGTCAIDCFQLQVMKGRLDTRRKKERDRIDAVMHTVPDFPAELEEWVHCSFMPESRYFFYDYSEKKREEGTCSFCGKKSRIDRGFLRHRKELYCPICGKRVTAIAKGKMPYRILDRECMAFLQLVDHKPLIRYCEITKTYEKKDPENCRIEIEEYLRLFGTGGKWKRYERWYIAYLGKTDWCDNRSRYNSNAVLCPVGLKEALQQTAFIYSGLEAFTAGEKDEKVDIPWYLDTWREHPCLEKLAKCGFHTLIQSFRTYWRNCIPKLLDEGGKRLFEVMKIPRGMPAVLPKETGPSELEFVQACCRMGYGNRVPDREAILKCLQLQVMDEKILEYTEFAPFQRIISYLTSRMETGQGGNFIRSWLDYLSWCLELGYDLHDRYYLLPKNFRREHDRVYREHCNRQEELKKRKREENRKKATDRLKEVREKVGTIGRGNMQIVVPEMAEAIEEEGRLLHHCVGDYVAGVADRSTLILFLRKKDSPEKPFRTLEWRRGRFVQCQGFHNEERNGEEVIDFLDFAEKKMLERLPEVPA